jgi:hypothetical protein
MLTKNTAQVHEIFHGQSFRSNGGSNASGVQALDQIFLALEQCGAVQGVEQGFSSLAKGCMDHPAEKETVKVPHHPYPLRLRIKRETNHHGINLGSRVEFSRIDGKKRPDRRTGGKQNSRGAVVFGPGLGCQAQGYFCSMRTALSISGA